MNWLTALGLFVAGTIFGGVIYARHRGELDTPVSVVPAAQADEPEHMNLFALEDPRNACAYATDAIAWQRDDSFATRLTVWCFEDRENAEGDAIVAWTQVEDQPYASSAPVGNEFYSQRVLARDADLAPYLAACKGDGFLGWSKGNGYREGGTTRRTVGSDIEITGFYGGLVWCVGDDFYAVSDGAPNDDDPYDHRFDIAKGVRTPPSHH